MRTQARRGRNDAQCLGRRGHVAVPEAFGRLDLLDHVDPETGGVEEAETQLAERLLGQSVVDFQAAAAELLVGQGGVLDLQLKAHVAYPRAKAGDEAAALDLLLDMAVAWLYEQRARFAPGLLYVAPHAQEATGDNAIPQALAAVCAAVWGGKAEIGIVQSDRVYHTGADAMERMAARAQFVGTVQPGERSCWWMMSPAWVAPSQSWPTTFNTAVAKSKTSWCW